MFNDDKSLEMLAKRKPRWRFAGAENAKTALFSASLRLTTLLAGWPVSLMNKTSMRLSLALLLGLRTIQPLAADVTFVAEDLSDSGPAIAPPILLLAQFDQRIAANKEPK